MQCIIEICFLHYRPIQKKSTEIFKQMQKDFTYAFKILLDYFIFILNQNQINVLHCQFNDSDPKLIDIF